MLLCGLTTNSSPLCALSARAASVSLALNECTRAPLSRAYTSMLDRCVFGTKTRVRSAANVSARFDQHVNRAVDALLAAVRIVRVDLLDGTGHRHVAQHEHV